VEELFGFITVLEGLKTLERFTGQYFWRDYPFPKRYESVADHSWRMAMMVVLIAPRLSAKLDLEKAIKMALIHDIPEIEAGDASPLGSDGTGRDAHGYSKEAADKKYSKEVVAARNLFGMAPEGHALYVLWEEFEAQESFEAKVVKAIDKIEGKLQVLEYTKGNFFPGHYEFTLGYGVEYCTIDPALEELMSYLVEKIRTSYQEFTLQPADGLEAGVPAKNQ
jgi:putative hydrolase of HD superfamily